MLDLVSFRMIYERNLAIWFLLYGTLFILYNGPKTLRQKYSQYKFNPSYPSNSAYLVEFCLSMCAVVIVTLQECIIISNFSSIDTENNFLNFNCYSLNEWYNKIIREIISFRVLFLILWTDMHFYWYHRLFHKISFLWKYVHKVHHRSRNVDVLSGLSFHPIESVFYFSPILILGVFSAQSVPAMVVSIYSILMLIGPIPGHSGMSSLSFDGIDTEKVLGDACDGGKGKLSDIKTQLLKKKKMNKKWFNEMGGLLANDTYEHYIHHTKFEYNYGSGLTPFWDTVMGTFYPFNEKEYIAMLKYQTTAL